MRTMSRTQTIRDLTIRLFLAVALCLAAGACCSEGSVPGAPYGSPDDVTDYAGTGGYASRTYAYYCLNGKFVSVTYTRLDDCSDFEKTSEYKTGGICW